MMLSILEEALPALNKLTHEIVLDPLLGSQKVKDLSEWKALDIVSYGFKRPTRYDTYSFWLEFLNSSTNFNRRRAAYILKTYFCDDLVPINIALPSEHGKSKHASDPACASCHYKLDPMGGFFRNYSYDGDYSKLDFMAFDDGKVLDSVQKEQYLANWRNPKGSAREWNIGFIRSIKNESENDYGESLEDLSTIIKSAPEVKQCLNKRMAEYFLGRGQVFDGAWLSELSTNFTNITPAQEANASTVAFKKVAKELLLSNTFSQRNPEPSKCYDFGKTSKNDSLPCEISHIVSKHFISCHSGDGATGGLNMAEWNSKPEGKGYFTHLDTNGTQLNPLDSFQRILDSLSTQDESKLMPYLQSMPAVERAQLFKWTQNELQKQ
jgi:hypothetical protein